MLRKALILIGLFQAGCMASHQQQPSLVLVKPAESIVTAVCDLGVAENHAYSNGSLTQTRLSEENGRISIVFGVSPVDNLLGFQRDAGILHTLEFAPTDSAHVKVYSTDDRTCMHVDEKQGDPGDNELNLVCLDHSTDNVYAGKYANDHNLISRGKIHNNVDDGAVWSMLHEYRAEIDKAFQEASEVITKREVAEYVEGVIRKELGTLKFASALGKVPLLQDRSISKEQVWSFYNNRNGMNLIVLQADDRLFTASYRMENGQPTDLSAHYSGKIGVLTFSYGTSAGGNELILKGPGHAAGGSSLKRKGWSPGKAGQGVWGSVKIGEDPYGMNYWKNTKFASLQAAAYFPTVSGKIDWIPVVTNSDTPWLDPRDTDNVIVSELLSIDRLLHMSNRVENGENSLQQGGSTSETFLPFSMLENKNLLKSLQIPRFVYKNAL